MTKKESYYQITRCPAAVVRKCEKISASRGASKKIVNILFPKWSNLGLLGAIFAQVVKTKEAPGGQIYDEASFRTVLRIIDGKVRMTDDRPDSYAWDIDTLRSKTKEIGLIGVNSAEGLINLSKILLEIKSRKEMEEVANMFANLKQDLIWVETVAETRKCIEYTDDMRKHGITCCLNEWEDDDGTPTLLNVGDFLIINEEKETLYCIRREEFLTTHILLSDD